MTNESAIVPENTCLPEMREERRRLGTTAVMTAPVEWIETVGNLRFPPKAEHRLQKLMDRNSEGMLTDGEQEELEALVELSEKLSLVRAEALQILGKSPE